MSEAYVRQLCVLSLTGDVPPAHKSEVDQLLQLHSDPLLFIFPSSKELGIATQASHSAEQQIVSVSTYRKENISKEVLISTGISGWRSST